MADMQATADAEVAPLATTTHDGSKENSLPLPQTPDVKIPAQDRSISNAFGGLLQSAGAFFKVLRYHTIRSAPEFLVNNSSNILGASHVATEMMMFKASTSDAKLVKHPGSWRMLYEPFETIWKDTIKRSGSGAVDRSKLQPNKPISNAKYLLTNLDDATKREAEFLFNKNGRSLEKMKEVRPGNPWQGRSTLAGLIVWGLSTVIPDQRESDEEVERMAILKSTNLPLYVGERLKEAVWVPDWFTGHKRQMIGLGIMASGVFSLLGSFRQREKIVDKPAIAKNFGMTSKYKFGVAYFLTSTATFISSLPLLFATDDEQGYSGFGAWMMQRLWALPFSIGDKFKSKDDTAKWYLAATASFQAENVAQALIGGAEVKNGVVTDNEELRAQAKLKAKEIKMERKHGHAALAEDAPNSKVTHVAAREAALPEHVAAHAASQQEAVTA